MLRYLHLDVFTSRLFEGNQLAVFPDPGALSTAQMQAIAREMAFSESTFIYPAEGNGDVKMRIFTPEAELPIAGHPTVGSTFALAAEGRIARGRTDFVFELGVGPTPVSLEWNGDQLAFVWMTQPLPSFQGIVEDRATMAEVLGVAVADLVPGLPIQAVACGVPFLYTALANRPSVDAVTVDRRKLVRACERIGLPELPVFVFTTAGGDGSTVYSRMLAPGFGVGEDPATGSASGPLGSYLVHHRVVSPEVARQLVSLQGVAMGRPSRIHISIDTGDSAITRVRVGGEAVMVGEGKIRV
ncbi:MAG TPA: PhzF family phenazine biosynthesis protein [Vicinamibacterales bacterium]|nr:PhzF family phenazine biosynthesis protein [Vicinamibacterales bacterium]